MSVASPLDAFIPAPDARERFAVAVKAPHDLVYDVTAAFDMQSVPLVRAILWMRERLLGSRGRARPATGFLAELEGLGWGCLAKRPGELYVGGALCRPWLADVVFTPLPPGEFARDASPGQVKIAWTIETTAEGAERTRLTTETRVVANDDEARRRFLGYWRWARFGILPIRWLLLPAIRREAERRWRARGPIALP